MLDMLAVQLALRAQLLSVPGLPAARVWENVEFVPVAGQPYIEEKCVPATSTLRGLTKGGVVEDTGLYFVWWYGLANADVTDIANGATAILARFTPGTTLTTSTGDTVRIRGDVAPSRGQIRQAETGWAVCTITIPFRCFTYNNPS